MLVIDEINFIKEAGEFYFFPCFLQEYNQLADLLDNLKYEVASVLIHFKNYQHKLEEFLVWIKQNGHLFV